MSRRLIGAFVLIVGLFVGMERYLKSAAAIEVDLLVVSCDEAWFSGQMETDADEVRVIVSRASDGFVLATQTFPTVQKQYANHIRYLAQPEGTMLTLSFGEWEFAYLQPPLVTDAACNDTQENRINQLFVTVTHGPTLMPSKTHTPSAIVTRAPILMPSKTHTPSVIVTRAPIMPSKTHTPFATVTPAPTLMPSKTHTPTAPINPELTATHYYWLVVTHGPGILTQLPPLPN